MTQKEQYKQHNRQRKMLERTEVRRNIVPALTRNITNLQELVELLNSDIDSYAKKRIAYSYLPLFVEQAKEEQELAINKDSKSTYRYKARFKIRPCDLPYIKGYDLLCKYGYYNKDTNPNGVVKDHRYSIAEGYRNNVPPEMLGKLSNCEFLRYKDNILKSDNCSIKLNQI